VDDLIFISITFWFFTASGGLIAICAQLMEPKT
jgi:hypothetical protein